MKKLILTGWCFLTISLAKAQTTSQVITVPSAVSGTATQQALVYLPSGYSTNTRAYPLLFFFCGAGETGTSVNTLNAYSPGSFITVGKSNGILDSFIIVEPQRVGWSPADWNAIARQMDQAFSQYRIDKNRVYMTGYSSGGWDINQFLQTDKDASYVTAIAPMSVADNPIPETVNNIVSNNIHVWYFGSDPQDVYGVLTHRMADSVNAKAPGLAIFTNYPGGHSGWKQFYDPSYRGSNNLNMYQFLLQYSKGAIATPPPADQPPVKVIPSIVGVITIFNKTITLFSDSTYTQN